MEIQISKTLGGALLASMFGDALGYPYEFTAHSHIKDHPLHPLAYARSRKELVITDDSQMAMATFDATKELIKNHFDASFGLEPLLSDKEGVRTIRRHYAKHYLSWALSPENNRSPGNTCMQELMSVYNGQRDGADACVNNSLGCGTVMRTPILATIENLRDFEVYHLGVLASEVTHGHPLACFVGGLAPLLVREFFSARPLSGKGLLNKASEVATKAARKDPLLVGAGMAFAREVKRLADNWDAIKVAYKETSDGERPGDLAKIAGLGWRADEALLAALAVAALAVDGAEYRLSSALLPAVYNSGDADSVACVGGWLFGAAKEIPGAQQEMVLSRLEPPYAIWVRENLQV